MENSEENCAISNSTAVGNSVETVSGSTPDALRNTPSNIARLEDVIEQCKGRQKYLAQTKSPSDGEDVRWYFCKVPLAEKELAAAFPHTEIVGKSEYFRFSKRDSLALEVSFLQREEELLSYWWKEYAECSEGPVEPSTSGKKQKLDSTNANLTTPWCTAEEEERVGVPVKGGLYEVDLFRRHCFPVYWSGENRRVLRGHWFVRKSNLDWFPLREDVAEQLELAYCSKVWHRRTFQPSGLFAARVNLQGTTQGLHALFTGEDDTWEAWLGVDNSSFSLSSTRGNGEKLRRGFSLPGSIKPTQDELRQQKEEEMDDYCSQVPVQHLVFMVHGIGQRLEKANLIDDVGDFRYITARLAERHLTSYQRNCQRVLFIPCQWRKGLKLGGESAVEKITLDGVRGLRIMLGATVHDVLYYMSPIYCQDIINSVSNQLNRLYLKFIKRNPGYDGKVSIYGHSLGSVLSYDILCHQHIFSSMGSTNGAQILEKCLIEDLQSTSDGQFTSENLENRRLCADIDDIAKASTSTCGGVDFSLTSNDMMVDKRSHNSWASPKTGIGSSVNNLSPLSEDEIFSSSNSCEVMALGEMDSAMKSMSEVCVDTYGYGNEEAIDRSEEKDMLIDMLKGEVNFLKERLARVESEYKSLNLSKDEDKRCNEGDAVVKRISNQFSVRNQSSHQDNSRKSYTPLIEYTKLEFKVDTFFAVGSPLGVFLALRNVRIGIGKGDQYWKGEGIYEEIPACRQMFNIFHPFDPVAYRVEPLVSKEYINKRPVIIPYHRGGKRLHIGFQEFTEDLIARSQAFVNGFHSIKVKMVSIFQLKNKNNLSDSEASVKATEEMTYGSVMMERLTGSKNGRIDYMLQDKTFEHAYISAIGAHTNYWRDYDTALFILKHLYRDIPEFPDSDNLPDDVENSIPRNPPVQFYSTDSIEDDLPLTFSDRMMIKEFSRRTKKIMRSLNNHSH